MLILMFSNDWTAQGAHGELCYSAADDENQDFLELDSLHGIADDNDLRHHFASRLIQVGVPLNTARDLLDHCSVAMFLAMRALGARPSRTKCRRRSASKLSIMRGD
jgi:hypothetical protein